jgi:hypothetical protein
MNSLKKVADKQAADARIRGTGSRLDVVVEQRKPAEKFWTFSFRQYRQIEFFAFDNPKISTKWFVSLLQRLADLGRTRLDEVFLDKRAADQAHFHPINWTQKNIPISRDDLHWVDEKYLKNPDEYPIRQFAISNSLGRVIGFLDESRVFQIILLDPLHNIQPTKSYGYQVNPCNPLDCELTQLRASIEHVLDRSPECECGVRQKVRQNLADQNRPDMQTILMVPTHEHVVADAQELIQLINTDYGEILKAGIETLLARA